MVGALTLQAAEEPLDHRVVPTVTLAAHALDHTMLFQDIPVLMAGILAASIRVMDQPSTWLATPDRHQQGITHQVKPRDVRTDQ